MLQLDFPFPPLPIIFRNQIHESANHYFSSSQEAQKQTSTVKTCVTPQQLFKYRIYKWSKITLEDIHLLKGQEPLLTHKKGQVPSSCTTTSSHPLPALSGSSSLHFLHFQLIFNHQTAIQDLCPERLQAKHMRQQTHLLKGIVPAYQ